MRVFILANFIDVLFYYISVLFWKHF